MNPLLPAFLYFVLVILAAHFFAPPGYTLTRNTVSDLGSQGHAHKWIMQAGFIGFGLLVAAGLAWKWRLAGRVVYPDLPILIYGLAILATGIFCTRPIDPSMSTSFAEARLHSIFATLAGITLCMSMLWYLFVSPSQRLFHLVFLVLVTGLSALFGLAENGSLSVGPGLIQKTMYLTAFIWLAVL